MVRGNGGDWRGTNPLSGKYSRWNVSGATFLIFSAKEWASGRDTTDTARGPSDTGKVELVEWGPDGGISPDQTRGRTRRTTHHGQHNVRGRTGFDRMARGSDCVSWLVGWPR